MDSGGGYAPTEPPKPTHTPATWWSGRCGARAIVLAIGNHLQMNSYRTVSVDDQLWGIEWTRDGVAQGLMLRLYDGGGEAAFADYELARAELERGADAPG